MPTITPAPRLGLPALLLLLPVAMLANAAPPPGPPSPSQWPALTALATDGPRSFVATHRGRFGGRDVRYRTSVTETIVAAPDGKPAASAFTLAITAENSGPAERRPVTFVYNGGPGGASNMLLLGAFGPKRVTGLSSAAMADPALGLVDNPDSVLDTTDLVFIDPPDTGFSRRLPGTPPRLFLSIDGDSFAIGQIIQRWLVANGRLASPKYLAGESYGTLRSVVLARDLARATPAVTFDGIVLISQAITYNGPASFGIRRTPDPLRAVNRLGDVAALAWYHGRIDNVNQTLPQVLERARRFARAEYVEALLLGNELPAQRQRAIAARLREFTGLPVEYFLARRLRIDDVRRELLKSDGLALAQFDGRETEPLKDLPRDEDRDWDAAMLGLTNAMSTYASRELGVRGLEPYVTVVHDPYGYEEGWTYLVPPAKALDLVLADVMREQPKLRLLVPQGLFDTTSSMGSTLALLAQLDVPRERIAVTYYAGGHMVYADADARRKFADDIRMFTSGRAPDGGYPSVVPARRSTAPRTAP